MTQTNVPAIPSSVHVDFLVDGKTPIVTSKDVKEFYEPNFRPVTYQDAKGEIRPVFNLTRDAFSLLAMGFTGKAAIQ